MDRQTTSRELTEGLLAIRDTPCSAADCPAHRYLDTLESDSGRKSMAHLVNSISRMIGAQNYSYIDWTGLDYQTMSILVTALRDKKYSPSTRNSYLAALKGVARTAWSMDQITLDQFERVRSIKRVRYHKQKTGKSHDVGVINALLRACDDDNAIARRDGAIIAMLVSTGLRRTELAQLQMRDINFETREVKVLGKGNKERFVMIPNYVWARITDYFERARGYDPGAVIVRFWNKRERPDIDSKGMDPSSINRRLDAVRKRASGLLGEEITPHDMRRTFTTNLHSLGLTLRELQVLLGHSSMTTTEGYLRDATDDYKSKAARLLDDQYQ